MAAGDDEAARWPALPLEAWRPTRDTLHLWTQLVGKTLLAASPPQNHWWHTTLRVSATGLAAPPIFCGGHAFDLALDFVHHELTVRRSDGRSAALPLAPRSVRAFHAEYLTLLADLGLDVHLWTMPVELADPIPFDADELHRDYDPAWARRFFEVLRRFDAVLRSLCDGFVGKQSPVLFFWGTFDLSATRYSGRRAPPRPGADRVTREAYSHEEISFGFWPGGLLPDGRAVDEPIAFAYAAPEPPGLRAAKVLPAAARYDVRLGEFVLPYAALAASGDPEGDLRAFCESVYAAAATLGGWDRAALERAPEAGGPAASGAHPPAPGAP